MASIELNIQQERELRRLLAYERSTCTVDNELVYHCAFPYRPNDDLQAELIGQRVLAQKNDGRQGTIVAITSDGYSYFPAKHQVEKERRRQEQREMHLVGLASLFAALCVVAGFLLGHFLT